MSTFVATPAPIVLLTPQELGVLTIVTELAIGGVFKLSGEELAKHLDAHPRSLQLYLRRLLVKGHLVETSPRYRDPNGWWVSASYKVTSARNSSSPAKETAVVETKDLAPAKETAVVETKDLAPAKETAVDTSERNSSSPAKETAVDTTARARNSSSPAKETAVVENKGLSTSERNTTSERFRTKALQCTVTQKTHRSVYPESAVVQNAVALDSAFIGEKCAKSSEFCSHESCWNIPDEGTLCGIHDGRQHRAITGLAIPDNQDNLCVECRRNPIEFGKYRLCEDCMDLKTEEYEDSHTDGAQMTDDVVRRIQARKERWARRDEKKEMTV
jgi:hypothetical protein